LPKILLHTCCAPCTTYVYQWLKDNEFEVRGLFYNPNIRPQAEYERRLLTMEYYSTGIGLKVINEPNDQESTPGDCANCYRVRLSRAAAYAKKLDFDCFSTTLLISPYQQHDLIRQIGEELGEKIGVPFFYRDFRMGYNQSRQMAKELKLYRQKYCGCNVNDQDTRNNNQIITKNQSPVVV
jgi:predicted adenine nucleotide alpha hydrolase (AANH) superfamily ATPase